MLRALSGLSRQEFFEKIGISASTIDTWESGRVELAQRSAERVCEAFKKVGVCCSAEWILTGNGLPPRIMDTLERTITDAARCFGVNMANQFGGVIASRPLQESHGSQTSLESLESLENLQSFQTLQNLSVFQNSSNTFGSNPSTSPDVSDTKKNLCSFLNFPPFVDNKIKEELCFFLSLNTGALYHVIHNDCFESRFREGDCLAGIPGNAELLKGKFVIIGSEEEAAGTIFGRLLSYNKHKQSCNLLTADSVRVCMESVEENKIAGVVWHRAIRSFLC